MRIKREKIKSNGKNDSFIQNCRNPPAMIVRVL